MSTETKAAVTKAYHVAMSAEEYHASDAHGSSMLETFRDSRRTFHAQFVAKTAPRKESTPAMKVGTLCHLKLFEPERFAAIVAEPYPAVAPDGKKWLRREGSDHANWWQEEIDKRDGKIDADEQTLDLVDSVVKAIRENKRANQLLSQDGKTEYPIFWTDPDTGLACKIMVDWFATISLDLKTSCDPSPKAYAESLANLGYHRKLAHYKCGLAHLVGKEARFTHIVAGTTAPHCVACYEVDDRDFQGFSLGVSQRRRTLFDLAECYHTDDWREPWEKSVVTLQLPGWAFHEDSYQY